MLLFANISYYTVYMGRICRDWHKTSERHKSYIVPTIEVIVKFLKGFSFLQWAIWIRNRPPEKYSFIESHKAVELYVLAYFILIEGFVAFYLVGYTNLNSYSCFVIIVLLLLAFRLADILGRWLDILILNVGVIASAPRLLLLTLLNYVEVGFIFTVLAFIHRYDFDPQFNHILDSLRWSFDILIPTIAFNTREFQPVSYTSNTIFYTEIALGFLFLIVFVSRVLTFFRREQEQV